jgi:hypothetical protein
VSLAIEVLFNGAFWLWLLGLMPAALVTVLKGRLLIFFAGWLTLGLTWFVGALSLAEPRSLWAQRFYDDEKLARAGDPSLSPVLPHVQARWLLAVTALFLAIGLFATRPSPIVGVDGTALQYSVGDGNLGSSVPPCTPTGNRIWSCYAYDDGFSGTVTYRVKTNRLGCWQAVRTSSSGEGADKRLSGCLTIWDEIRLLNAVL